MSPLADAVLPEVSYLNHDTSLRSWIFTHDHKRIGVIFLILTALALALGGTFAMLIRIEHLTPGPTIMSALTYNRLFSLHGVVMVWLFMIPAIPSGFGNFFVPIMIGAKDVAFPRLNLLSVWLYVIGAAIALAGMIWGGVDTGWTFYTPYSTTSPTAVIPVLMGVFVIGFSTIATGVNLIVTVHTMRAPGLTWMRIPLFVWAVYGTAAIQTLATPVLGLTVLLVALERFAGIGIFDPARSGDPLLFQHLFWFYSHPAVYIMVLPAMGVVSETVCAFSRKNIFGYRLVAISTFGIAMVGFFAWGHHLFVSGESTASAGAFGVLSMFVAIFTAIKVFTWSATLYKGSISLRTPLVYVLGFLFLLVFGGMTGVALATTSLDLHWTDTYFVVAHFHFIMVGAVLLAYLSGLHYWWPKMFGRMYPERPALVAAVTIIFGFIATFLPQFLLGNLGMPRRYFDYPPEFQWLQVASTLGASLLGFGFLIVLVYLLVSLKHGAVAGDNPWGSAGYEWFTPSPPPTHNFPEVPVFERPAHDYQVPPRRTQLHG
jgi:cytochrome c oxidase subunit 1